MKLGVNHAAIGSTKDKVYIFGGRERKINVPDDGIDVVQVYTVRTNSWAFGPKMLLARGGTSNAPFFGGYLWLIGGEAKSTDKNPLGVYQDVHAFDPNTGEWRDQFEPLPIGLHGIYPIADTKRGNIIVAGGGTKAGRSDTNTVLILQK
jgi:N-acetylneuraminic acid mutarotase